MPRIFLVIVAGLVAMPWQASLAAETGLQQAIRIEVGSLRTSGHISVDDVSIAAPDLIGEVYGRRGFAPAWEDPGQVELLLEAVRSAYGDGLSPADYQLATLEKLQQANAVGRDLSPGEQAVFDLVLTDSLCRLVYHLHYGKVDPDTRAATWVLGRQLNGRDPATVITEIIDADVLAEAIYSAAPRDSGYDRLKAELQRHRLIAAAGGWPVVPGGPTIRPDSDDPRVGILAVRLEKSGDLAGNNRGVAAASYGPVLQAAVRRFQARHGLEVDGLVGRATLRALNVSIGQRIDQLRLNLERARWRLNGQVEDHILVNVAGFKAYVIRGRKNVRTVKVIVGEPEDQTPLFKATMNHIVLNPTWTVPYSIASEELLPKIKGDPDFLVSGNYQLLDRDGIVIDWSAVDWSTIHIGNFPFTLVQQPGSANQLGKVKFMFPNEYSVCMHDSPARWLFTEATRAFSHGCIRVDDPIDLAELLLGYEGWTRTEIDAQIASGETRTIVLAQPLPVVVAYWTAEVDEQGEAQFYDDIYDRDAAVLEALDKPL